MDILVLIIIAIRMNAGIYEDVIFQWFYDLIDAFCLVISSKANEIFTTRALCLI